MYLTLCRVIILVSLPVLMPCAENGYNIDYSDTVRMINMIKRVGSLDEDMTNLQATNDKQDSRLSQLESVTFERERKLDEQETYNVAFSYGYDERDEFSREGETIKFRNEFLVVGRGYNHSDGIFTCPRKGMYLFTLLATSRNAVHIELKVNGNSMATLYVEDKGAEFDQSSVTIVVFLNEGDIVSPMTRHLSAGATLAAAPHYTQFSGVLLKLT